MRRGMIWVLVGSSNLAPIDFSLGKEAPGQEASKSSCNSATLMILTMHGTEELHTLAQGAGRYMMSH